MMNDGYVTDEMTDAGSVIFLPETPSTNTYAKDHFDALSDGTLVATDHQTAGRGRLGRKWSTPPGAAVAASFVIKNPGEDPFSATCCASLAVLRTLRDHVPEGDFYIKWPNDVYTGSAKIAGILCEGVIRSGGFAGIIAGMGININLSEEDLCAIDQKAESLNRIAGKKFNVKKITFALAKSLSECYIIYLKNPEELFRLWKKENRLLGKTVEFDKPDGSRVRGMMSEILPDGSILVEHDGVTENFRCGDIRIAKKSL